MKLAKQHKTKKESRLPVSRVATPFWPMRRLQQQIDRLFEEPFGGWFAPEGPVLESWMPALDVYEEKDNVIVKAELPGMKKEEFEVYMSGGNLNIAGERKAEREEKTAQAYRAERCLGRFHRSIALPTEVKAEAIKAHFKDGMLTVICPKAESSMHKQIEVKVD